MTTGICQYSKFNDNELLLIGIFFFNTLIQCEDRFYTPESDVYRRQILSKVGPRTEAAKYL